MCHMEAKELSRMYYGSEGTLGCVTWKRRNSVGCDMETEELCRVSSVGAKKLEQLRKTAEKISHVFRCFG